MTTDPICILCGNPILRSEARVEACGSNRDQFPDYAGEFAHSRCVRSLGMFALRRRIDDQRAAQ